MGGDGLKVGVQIMKFVIIATRMCYRSVSNHPFVVGTLLLLLFLYRSFPFLFSILVSSSPVLVCTAVLLGALLSFGETNIVSESGEDEKSSVEIAELKTGRVENNTTVVEEYECFGKDSRYSELRREFVKVIDEEPLLDKSDKLDKSETDHAENDVAFSSMSTDHNSREVEKQSMDEAKTELENTEIEQTVDLGDQMFRMGVGVGFSHGEILQTRLPAGEIEHFEDYISAEGSFDAQMRDNLISSLESQKHSDEVLADSSLSDKEVQYENFEDYKSADGSVDAQTRNQLEPSLASWKQFDVLDDRLSTAQEFQEERYLGYSVTEGSSEVQLRDYLESSMRSWKQMGSDHDEDVESDSGSDGAESSSPDASMADIIPMLDELHPLLDDENPQVSKLSRQSSAATMERSAISPDSSIHSEDESDQKDEEADDGKSDAGDDNAEETQGSKKGPVKSVIMWTEDDQKNLMDLGTSELERNQRLESLIARRRARKMAGDGNLIDLDGMDLPFPVAPISTRRHNPFDLPQDSYADLGLPPIPGSAPSIMLARRNPFDLPYDSSEEKPDLMGDSFQQEFMELTQREAFNQREALLRRNETFNMGSSGFDFGRPSRFRPYFVPERTDSDMMSYSSLQRQLSELSESKASSAAETESTCVGADQEEKKLVEHYPAQEVETSEIDNASVLVELGSQSFEDLDSLLGEEKENKDIVLSEIEVELSRARSSPAADSDEMSYSSLQRHLSGHSESKESSVAEKEPISVGADQEEKQVMKYDSAQEAEHNLEIDYACTLVEHGSQSSEDLDSLSDEEKDKKDFVLSVLEVELGRAKASAAAASYTSETVESADNSLDDSEIDPAVESWLSHNKVSHSEIQSKTELIEVNDNICSSPLSLSAPSTLTDEKMDDVGSCMVNRKKIQANNLVNVDIPVNYSQDPSASDVTTCLSLETSERSLAAEVHENHPKESIYDLSPLKQNNSLSSSSSSDLQRETSGIDLYHLSTDLFVVEKSNVQNKGAEDISQHTNQDAGSNGLTLNDIGESSGLDSTDFFSELNQLPCNSQTLVVAEDEGRLSVDSSDREFKDKASDNKVSPQEVEQILAQEDGDEIHLENKLDNNRISDNMTSADGQEFAEDSVISQKEKEVVLADNIFPVHTILSSSQVELKDKIEVELKVELEQFQVSSSRLKSDESNGNETLKFLLDENHFFPHDTDIHEPQVDPAKQERSIHQKLEEVDQINKVDELANVLMVQEPQHETLSDPGQSNVSSYQAKDSETNSIAELDIKEHVQDVLETRHASIVEENHEVFKGFEESTADELILYEDSNDAKEMDEVLLSELDAVGDFRMSDIIPSLDNSVINPHTAINSNIPAEIVGDVHSTETPFDHETLLGDSSPVGNFESEGKITGTNLPESKKSNLDSHPGHVSTDLLDLEAQSVEDIDAVFKKVNEVHESVVTESAQAEFTREEVEVPFPENKLLSEDIEPGAFPSAVTLKNDAALNTRESVPDRIQSDLSLLEVHNLDNDWRDTVSGISVLDAELIEQSGEDIEKVEAGVDKSDIIEAVQAVAETVVDCMEPMLLQTDRDVKEIEESPLLEASTATALEPSNQTENVCSMESPLLEASTAPALEPSNQTDSVGSMESESLSIDREIKEIEEYSVLDASDLLALESEDGKETIEKALESEDGKETLEKPVLEASVAPAVDSEKQIERNTSEQLLFVKESKEIQESPLVGFGIGSALNSEHQMEKFDTATSESLPIEKQVKETQEFPSHEGSIVPNSESEGYTGKVVSSELLQLDRGIHEVQESPAVEVSIPLVLESEKDKEVLDYGDSEQLQRDSVVEELRDWHVVEGAAPIELQPLQTDTDIKEIEKSPYAEASIPVPETEDQILTMNSGKSGLFLDRNVGELKELPVVEAKVALAVESEGPLERVGFVEPELLQMDGDFKEIQESPALNTSYASAVEFKDQMEVNSQMEVIEGQALQDHQLVSQQQPEVDVPNNGSRGVHGDSSTTDSTNQQ